MNGPQTVKVRDDAAGLSGLGEHIGARARNGLSRNLQTHRKQDGEHYATRIYIAGRHVMLDEATTLC